MEIKQVGTTRPIDSCGRVVIPKKIREVFELEIGNEVEFYKTDNGILIVKVEEEGADK